MFQCNRLLLFISLMAQTLCCQGQVVKGKKIGTTG